MSNNPNPPEHTNDWDEYQRLVMYRLDTIDSEVRALRVEQTKLQITLAQLQTLSSIWGGITGTLTALITAFFLHLTGRDK